MVRQLISAEDAEELKRFPNLWRQVQAAIEEGTLQVQAAVEEGTRQVQAAVEDGLRRQRAHVLDTLVARLDPPASDYRRIEHSLETIDDADRLDALFDLALRAKTLADFAREIGPSASDPPE